MHFGIKVGIGLFINTIGVPLYVFSNKEKWFDYGNLITFTCLNIVIMSLIPILNWADIKYCLLKKIRRCWYGRKKTSLDWTKTQAEMNTIFEPPEFDVGMNFARLSMLIIVPIVFFPIFPLGPIISCFGLLITYNLEKVKINS